MCLSVASTPTPRGPSLETKKGISGALPKASLQLLPLFLLLRCQEALLWRLVLVRDGVSIHDTHAANTVRSYITEVPDQ